MGGFAWVTLATNDSYSLGALVLAHSLRRVGTQHDLAVLITPGVTSSMREKLASVFTLVREVNVLDSKDEANLTVLQRPELGITFTKLHCWRLTQYEKCVFVDADALVVRNCDELFEREELSAAPDVGWPDCFNSGVFVFKPSQQTFTSITSFAASQGSFDGADQGLLNMYFSDWAHKDISKHLPFIYNMCSTATYSYAPAFKQYGENVRIVHFIGATKPWLQYFDTLTGIVQPPPGCNHLQPLLQIWWNIFCDNVHPQLTDVMAASNMSAIWHDSNPLIINSNTYNCARHLFNPDQDTYNETDSGTPDFSEFKDPWENYSVNTDPFINNIQQQTDDNKQYYSDVTHSHYTEPDQLISHNQCGAEPPPSREQSTSSSNEQDHSSLHSDQIFQASPQDNFSFENETHQDIVEHGHHYESHEVSKKQCSTDKTISDSDLLAENIEELSMIYDLLDSIRNELDSDNHTSHQNIHSPHHSDNINEPSTSTASCTDPNNVETQNEMSASPCAENAHGGLAGALSRLTLGETRTDEQQLIEDHMRKQNWEQGHIDYMGRDSFDNIIKKMNQTLAAAPARQPSPAKETRQPKKSSLKSSEVEGAVEESESPLPVLATQDEAESKTSQVPLEDTCQRILTSEEIPSSAIEQLEVSKSDSTSCEQTSASTESTTEIAPKSVPTSQVADVPQQSEEAKIVLETLTESTVETKSTETTTPEPAKETQVPQDTKQDVVETSAPLQQIAGQILSEATTECPVPIQVAESVLQAEPKETVSEDPRPVIEAVVSSIIPPVQESASAVSETLFESGQAAPVEPLAHPHQLNGDDPTLQHEAEKIASSALVSRSPNVVSVVHEFAPRAQQEATQDNQSVAQVGLPELSGSQPTAQATVPELSESQTTAQISLPELSGSQPATQVSLPELSESQPTTQVSSPEISESQSTVQVSPSELPKSQLEAQTSPAQTTESQLTAQVDPPLEIPESQSITQASPPESEVAAEVIPSEIPKSSLEAEVVESQPAIQETKEVPPQFKSEDILTITQPKETSTIPEAITSKLETETSTEKSKLTVKLPEAQTTEEAAKEVTAATTDSPAAPVSTSDECPLRPTRTKDLKIPTTPVVIGPTPPTSPPLEAESAATKQEETQKQVEAEIPTEEKVETQPEPTVKTNVEVQSEKATEDKPEAQSEAQSQPPAETVKKVKKIVKKSSAESDTPSSPESEGSGKKW